MKNKFLTFAMASGVALALAACGAGGTEPQNQPAAQPNNAAADAPAAPAPEATGELAGNITFSWWGDDGRHTATRAIAELFMDENPDVNIDFFYAPWSGFQDVFAGDLMAGTEADLMQVNFNWLQLYSPFGTTFADLEDPVIAAHLNLSNWDASEIDMVRTNGVVQAVPSGITARVPFIRTDIWESAGINYLEVNTWDDVMAAGRQLQAELGTDHWLFGKLGNASTAYFLFSFLEQYTGRPFVDENYQFSYTLEELTTGFQLIQDLMDNGVFAYGQFDSSSFNSTNEHWIAGRFGAVFEWDSSMNNWINNLEGGQDVISVRDHFTLPNALSSGVMVRPSMAFAISNNSNHPDVAAAFLNFMLTDARAVEIMGTDRGIPANNVGLSHFQALAGSGDPRFGDAAVRANAVHANADSTIMSPAFEFPTVRAVYETQVEALIYGFITVEEAAAFVYNNIQAEIDAELS